MASGCIVEAHTEREPELEPGLATCRMDNRRKAHHMAKAAAEQQQLEESLGLASVAHTCSGVRNKSWRWYPF